MVRAIKVILLIVLILPVSLNSQDIRDAILFGQSSLSGTARSMGMGGTSVALGADYSATSINPAGIGLSTKSSLVIAPALQIINANSEYIGINARSNKSAFGLSSLGFIIAPAPREGNFKGLSVAFGYNQIANSSVKIRAEAFNTKNSMSYFFASIANGIDYNSISSETHYYSFIGWNSYFIDTIPGTTNSYIGVVPNNVFQEYAENRKFRIGEWNLALAGNWDNRLFIGFGIGIQDISAKREIALQETDTKNLHNTYDPNKGLYDFESALFLESIQSSGVGINASLGVIFHPMDYFRIGFSMKSPTAISMKDIYVASLDPVRFDNGDVYSATTQEFLTRYSVVSPYEVNAGALLLIGKIGLIQADINYKDYTQINFESRDGNANSYSYLNRAIADFLTSTYRVRIGGEIKLDNMYLRAGAGYITGILSEKGKIYYDENGNSNQIDPSQLIFSVGTGFRSNNVVFDLAILRQERIEKFLPYYIDGNTFTNMTPVPTIITKYGLTDIVFSIGFIIE